MFQRQAKDRVDLLKHFGLYARMVSKRVTELLSSMVNWVKKNKQTHSRNCCVRIKGFRNAAKDLWESLSWDRDSQTSFGHTRAKSSNPHTWYSTYNMVVCQPAFFIHANHQNVRLFDLGDFVAEMLGSWQILCL